MIAAQGGDPDAPLPVARHTQDVLAPADGFLDVDALAVGVAAWRLGAGRSRREEAVQAGAGVELHAVRGDRVHAGQRIMTLHTDTPDRFDWATQALDGGFTVSAGEPAQVPLIHQRITA
jgi:thymidine phosphorylase